MTNTVPQTTAPLHTATETRTATDRFLAAVRAGAVTADLYEPDATLDAVVPNWRMQVSGAPAIAAEYARWFAHPARIDELRRHRTDTGEVVEYTVHWVEDKVPHAGRHVHVLDLSTAGLIQSDHVWCGGRWPATLLADMHGAVHDS